MVSTAIKITSLIAVYSISEPGLDARFLLQCFDAMLNCFCFVSFLAMHFF